MQIEINTRLYNDISKWCEANGFEPLKYIEKTLREHIAIDKYGDLNEKVQKEPVSELETKSAKREVKPKKTVPTIEDKDKSEKKQTVKDEEVESMTIDTPQEEIQIVEKKKQRTLKTK